MYNGRSFLVYLISANPGYGKHCMCICSSWTQPSRAGRIDQAKPYDQKKISTQVTTTKNIEQRRIIQPGYSLLGFSWPGPCFRSSHSRCVKNLRYNTVTREQDGTWKRNILWRSVCECDLIQNDIPEVAWYSSKSEDIILAWSVLIVIFVSEVEQRVLIMTYYGFKCKLEVTEPSMQVCRKCHTIRRVIYCLGMYGVSQNRKTSVECLAISTPCPRCLVYISIYNPSYSEQEGYIPGFSSWRMSTPTNSISATVIHRDQHSRDIWRRIFRNMLGRFVGVGDFHLHDV